MPEPPGPRGEGAGSSGPPGQGGPARPGGVSGREPAAQRCEVELGEIVEAGEQPGQIAAVGAHGVSRAAPLQLQVLQELLQHRADVGSELGGLVHRCDGAGQAGRGQAPPGVSTLVGPTSTDPRVEVRASRGSRAPPRTAVERRRRPGRRRVRAPEHRADRHDTRRPAARSAGIWSVDEPPPSAAQGKAPRFPVQHSPTVGQPTARWEAFRCPVVGPPDLRRLAASGQRPTR